MNRNRHSARAVFRKIGGQGAAVFGSAASAGRAPRDLKQAAEAARASEDWTADLYHRRLIVEADPDRFGAWMQFGHALKEAGFHSRSKRAYDKALEIKPDDADAYVQLGHLGKVRGDFAEAERAFRRALELGCADREGVAFELDLLKRVDNTKIFQDFERNSPRTPLRIFLSVPNGPVSEGDKAAVASGLGQADYSYSFAMRGFIDALEQMELDYTVLAHPEYISDIRARSNADFNLHLSFYPPERIRLLKGAYNVNCFAWEFDRLRSAIEVTSYHAFADQATMLDLADEIWVPSTHGAQAVRDSGVQTPVRFVAAPVLNHLTKRPRAARPSAADVAKMARGLADAPWRPLAVLPRIQSQMDEGAASRQASLLAILSRFAGGPSPTVFMTVFNAHDFRKQIGPLVEGFIRFEAEHPDALLLLKMTSPDKGNSINKIISDEQINDLGRMIPPMISEKVWITQQVLTREELNRLYDLCSFYVCTSYAEGQNLPLLEAMGRGVVPLTVDHTAMIDYIRPDNAVIVPSKRRPFDKRLTRRYGLFGLSANFVSVDDVASALLTAHELPADAYAEKSRNAHDIVQSDYGISAFARKFNEFLAEKAIPQQVSL